MNSQGGNFHFELVQSKMGLSCAALQSADQFVEKILL